MSVAAPFLALTFLISLIAFAGIYKIPGAQTPESPRGLPVWLLAVWGPSLAAIVLTARSGELADLLARVVMLSGVPAPVWAMAFSPVAALALVVHRHGGIPQAHVLTNGVIAKLVLLNLVLGPLGEELGWRGVLQPELADQVGWVAGSLVVGAIWFAWHLPLWLVDSPQSEIPIPLFGAHVMAYAVILGAMTHLSPSLAPAILFHLWVNVAAGLALLGGLGTSASYFRATLLPYWGIAFAATAWVLALG
ncbi:CPBP family intramembrane glutamic endopeptidase [Nioella aestuarii]|uniref:CPBP family intramembrane glutamic endopeptidase n=1 Tax=Nioella aestuarii TaxID=1662864 RepID=UPI003D7FD284